MIGMEHVADQIEDLLDERREREELVAAGKLPKDAKPPFNNMLMVGQPGTGKTTIAEQLARALALSGLSDSNTVVETKPSDIAGTHVGDAADNMRKLLEKAKGGVLFVDEAHQFADNQLLRDALRSLVAPLSDPRKKTMVVFAGYPDQMGDMLKIDPGLASRFPLRMDFKPYDAEALVEIADLKIRQAAMGFANVKAEHAMEDAVESIAALPDQAGGRDVEIMVRYANDARRRRVRTHTGKKKVNPYLYTESDWQAAAQRFASRRQL